MLKNLTIDEKMRLLSGDGWWNTYALPHAGVDSVIMCDGPHGLRRQTGGSDHLGIISGEHAICYPTENTVANSFNKELLFEIGKMIGKEAASAGVDLVLGPGVNIKRSPLCGRNFEYYSEDAVLSGELAAAFINGLQMTGVGACIKHYACNNTETKRLVSDSRVDRRTMHEVYLKAFEIAVKKSQPRALMCSYNKINGTYACQHKELITDVLRGRWGFKGITISDWGAVSDSVASVKAGLDLEMPFGNGSGFDKLKSAYAEKNITEKEIDKAVKRLLNFIKISVKNRGRSVAFVEEEAERLARKAVTESIVLLKNDNSFLPLATHEKILVVGKIAEEPHYQGGGSSRINVKKAISLLDGLDALGIKYDYLRGYEFGGEDAILADEVLAAAKDYDAVIIAAGLAPLSESEGFDRKNLDLPDCINSLIEKVSGLNQKTIVLLYCGAPVVTPWLESVSALLYCGLTGQEGGYAVADILYGKDCPSGKLAETWAYRLEDTPSYCEVPSNGDVVEYREGVFVGYRHYEANNIKPLFPFGYGLSYTTFEYGNAEIASCGNGKYSVRFDLTNTGKMTGQETAMLFVARPVDGLIRPRKELLDFCKVRLNAGQTRTIEFSVDHEALKTFDVDANGVLTEGIYTLSVCSGADKTHSSVTLEIKAIKPRYTVDSTLGELSGTIHGAQIIETLLSGNHGNGMPKIPPSLREMLYDMPLRGLGMLYPKEFSTERISELLAEINT